MQLVQERERAYDNADPGDSNHNRDDTVHDVVVNNRLQVTDHFGLELAFARTRTRTHSGSRTRKPSHDRRALRVGTEENLANTIVIAQFGTEAPQGNASGGKKEETCSSLSAPRDRWLHSGGALLFLSSCRGT